MIRLDPHRLCCGAFAAVALLCLSSCAVPLAPGYRIEKQSITVHFVPGPPPRLAVRAEYRLANAGNAPLGSIEVALPDQKSFGRENLRVQVNGKDVAPQIARGEEAEEGESVSSEAWPVVFRIPFSPAWPRKRKRNLVIEYDLTAAIEPHLRMYVSPTMFYLNDSAWFPDPLAPKSFLAKDVVRPDPSDLTVIVPENFVATGSGELRGARKSAAETEYRFRLRKDDFDPFVIAGHYYDQRITTTDGTVSIWTFNPILSADAQKTAAQIATAASFYAKTFGSLPLSMKAIYDVELPHEAFSARDSTDGLVSPFLPGVVYDSIIGSGNSSTTGSGIAAISSLGKIVLAYTWFGHAIRPQSDSSILAAAIAGYAADLPEKANNNPESRTASITSDLKNHDDGLKSARETPIVMLNSNSSSEQLALGADKLRLFLSALEDRCGPDNLNHALAHMVSALRFQQYDYDDFRSALEQECHQDLGPFFRHWLNEKGIPADFRAKYDAPSEKKN